MPVGYHTSTQQHVVHQYTQHNKQHTTIYNNKTHSPDIVCQLCDDPTRCAATVTLLSFILLSFFVHCNKHQQSVPHNTTHFTSLCLSTSSFQSSSCFIYQTSTCSTCTTNTISPYNNHSYPLCQSLDWRKIHFQHIFTHLTHTQIQTLHQQSQHANLIHLCTGTTLWSGFSLSSR